MSKITDNIFYRLCENVTNPHPFWITNDKGENVVNPAYHNWFQEQARIKEEKTLVDVERILRDTDKPLNMDDILNALAQSNLSEWGGNKIPGRRRFLSQRVLDALRKLAPILTVKMERESRPNRSNAKRHNPWTRAKSVNYYIINKTV